VASIWRIIQEERPSPLVGEGARRADEGVKAGVEGCSKLSRKKYTKIKQMLNWYYGNNDEIAVFKSLNFVGSI
jgi:hypothetical protein